MMLKIDYSDMPRAMFGWERQIPFALAQAINKTLKEAKGAELAEILRVFDRPTPRTQKSIFTIRATKQSLTGSIYLKDSAPKGSAPTKYLKPEIEGGGRKAKRFEIALRSNGLLTGNLFAVPGAAAPLDQYGNIPGGKYTQMLGVLKSHYSEHFQNESPTSLARKSRRGRQPARFFVGRPGGGRLPMGVWQKVGQKIRPILIFTKQPTYTERFKFYDIAHAVVNSRLREHFAEALVKALRTAR